jgi:hypothetical protein
MYSCIKRSNSNVLDQNELKRIKRETNECIKDHAFKDLLSRHAANGEKAIHGDIQDIVNQYNALNYNFVTRDVIKNRLKKIMMEVRVVFVLITTVNLQFLQLLKV